MQIAIILDCRLALCNFINPSMEMKPKFTPYFNWSSQMVSGTHMQEKKTPMK